MRKPRRFGIFAIMLVLGVGAGLAPALAQDSDPAKESQLRAAASDGNPKGNRELACYLHETAEASQTRLAEAYALMRDASNCGDDIATLYVASYLRMGTGTPKDEELANLYLKRVMDSVRESRFPGRPDGIRAARLLGRPCSSPDDEITPMRLQRMHLQWLK